MKTAHEARGLKDVQTIGKQDPFLEARLGKQKDKSRVHDDGNDVAKWGDEFRFALRGSEKTLELICKNENIFVDKEIGRVSIPVSAIVKQKSGLDEKKWFKITRDGEDRGEISVSVIYMRPWLIRVTEGRDLYDTQTFGKQDPYVQLKVCFHLFFFFFFSSYSLCVYCFVCVFLYRLVFIPLSMFYCTKSTLTLFIGIIHSPSSSLPNRLTELTFMRMPPKMPYGNTTTHFHSTWPSTITATLIFSSSRLKYVR